MLISSTGHHSTTSHDIESYLTNTVFHAIVTHTAYARISVFFRVYDMSHLV